MVALSTDEERVRAPARCAARPADDAMPIELASKAESLASFDGVADEQIAAYAGAAVGYSAAGRPPCVHDLPCADGAGGDGSDERPRCGDRAASRNRITGLRGMQETRNRQVQLGREWVRLLSPLPTGLETHWSRRVLGRCIGDLWGPGCLGWDALNRQVTDDRIGVESSTGTIECETLTMAVPPRLASTVRR